MRIDPRLLTARAAAMPIDGQRWDRRRMIGALAALGLSTAAAPRVLASDGAAPSGGHAGHMAAAQEGGAGAPVATPQLGERADGSFTHKVVAGGGEMEEMIDLLAFFPEEVTVNAGDSIFWETRGFHNVHFLPSEELPALIVPESTVGGVGSPAASPAGAQPRLVLNPAVVSPRGGTTYDGSGEVNSGALDPGAPFVLTFTAPGEYDYYCTIHGEVMKGRVVVREEGTERAEDQAAIDRRAAGETEAMIAEARDLIEQAAAAGSPAAPARCWSA